MRWLRAAVLGVLILGLGGLLSVYGLMAGKMAENLTQAKRNTQEDTPVNHNLNFKDVSFSPRGENLTLRGWYMAPHPDAPVIIFVHGMDVTRSSHERVRLAAQFIERGFNVLLFDLRSHGDSEGGRTSGGYFEQRDVLGAFDFLVQQGVPAGRIGLLGFSLGGATAILTAAQEDSVRAVAADSPYADIEDLIVQETIRKTEFSPRLIPWLVPGMKIMARLRYGIDVGALVPERAVVRLTYPIFLIHGGADDRILPSHSERIIRAASPGSELWLVPGVGHTNAHVAFPEEYVQRVGDYFKRRLADNVR